MARSSAIAQRRRSQGRGRTLAVVVAIAAALVALALAAAGSSGSPDDVPAATSPGERAPDRGPEIRGAGPMSLGEEGAPVVMVMYSEFQCPFCGKFARDTEPELVERFVDEGILRIEWRDLPYLGQESLTAAAAGRAAADQDAFWPFAAQMYADQPPPNSGVLTTDHLVGVAQELGLDGQRFRSVMEDDATLEDVRADVDDAVQFGVSGTPTFFINGQVVVGAQPTEVFVEAIERAAASSR
jgi:protein-disulfide isomerase